MTLSEFFFKVPLYKGVEVVQAQLCAEELCNNLDLTSLKYILNARVEKIAGIEGYNSIAGYESTFNPLAVPQRDYSNNRILSIYENPVNDSGGIDLVVLECRRNRDKFYFLIQWNPSENTLMKVGQYPSYADIHIHDTKKYNSVLDKDKLKEFVRAIGLHANGVGIGAFVYLRRIFEYLIWDAYETSKQQTNSDIQDFEKKRIEEKIAVVKDYLPEFLVQNRSIYALLSKGIHELSEEECLTYFDIVKTGIEIILDQKLEMSEKKKKEDDARKQLASLSSKLGKSNTE